MRIGSSILETCMAAQRAIRARIEPLEAPEEELFEKSGPGPEGRRSAPHLGPIKSPQAQANGAGPQEQRRGGDVRLRREDAESPIPRRRFERLFSELRRRSRET